MTHKSSVSITREGWLFLVVPAIIMIGSLIQQINLLMVLGGVLLGVMLLSRFIAARALRNMEIKRLLPSEISAGDLLVVDLQVANKNRWSPAWAVHLHDKLRLLGGANTPPELHSDILVAKVDPRQTLKTSYRGRLMQRGRYEFGPLEASTRFPLGLMQGAVKFDSRGELLVTPRLGVLNHGWRELQREADMGSRQSRHRAGVHEGDFYGLREWRDGDSRRWIHWRTTAKRGRLMVRQFEQSNNQDFALILDLWAPQSPTDAHNDAVELAVSFAATIFAELFRAGGSRLLFGAAAETTRITHGPMATAMVRDLTEYLATVQPTHEDKLPAILGEAGQRISPGMGSVIISTRSIRLSERPRFACLDRDHTRSPLQKATCIDCSRDSAAEYFSPR